jgi:c-di-GMP-binding flagellar brake protein YcgR
MATSPVSLIPVRVAELAVGKPLRQAIYDSNGKLLLAAGNPIESHSQLSELAQGGFIRDSSWDFMGAGPSTRARKDSLLIGSGRTSETAGDNGANANKEVIVGMDDVRWLVGETLYLQLADNSTVRYTVRLIGYVKNGTIFVSAPMVDNKLEFVRDGQTFVVRAFSGQKAYAFAAHAVKSVHAPHPYLHLSYPKSLRCTVVRNGARAEVNIAATLSLGQPERVSAATLSDLSVGGASGILKQPFGEKGDAGKIRFKVNAVGQDETLDLKVVLRSVAPSESGDGFKHGFEFMEVSPHDRLILSAFVHQTLADGQ